MDVMQNKFKVNDKTLQRCELMWLWFIIGNFEHILSDWTHFALKTYLEYVFIAFVSLSIMM